jgi:hypothetical protein
MTYDAPLKKILDVPSQRPISDLSTILEKSH